MRNSPLRLYCCPAGSHLSANVSFRLFILTEIASQISWQYVCAMELTTSAPHIYRDDNFLVNNDEIEQAQKHASEGFSPSKSRECFSTLYYSVFRHELHLADLAEAALRSSALVLHDDNLGIWPRRSFARDYRTDETECETLFCTHFAFITSLRYSTRLICCSSPCQSRK